MGRSIVPALGFERKDPLKQRTLEWGTRLMKYIGKESNSLEDVESGAIHSEQKVYTEYHDPKRDEWQTRILPVLKNVPLALLVQQCEGKISLGER